MSKKLEKEIEELKKRVAELEANKAKAVELPFWMPEEGQATYYLDSIGGDWQATYSHNGTHQELLIGNYFKTKKLAQRHVDKLKLLEEIKQWRGKHDPESFKLGTDGQGDRMELVFDTQASQWDWLHTSTYKRPLSIFFSTPETAQDCIDHFGDRLDLLLERDGE